MISKNDYEIISDTAYLYSTWSGNIAIKIGRVVEHQGFRNTGTGTFIDENEIKIVSCHLEPGKIYNASVWLPQRDDEKAKEILVKYHENEIKKLKEKIENHINKINIIQGGIKNE